VDKSIIQLVDELPTDNITVKVLNALNYVVPGTWDNLVGFDKTISAVTGETDSKVIQKIRDRATSLYNDPQKGYKNAVALYQNIDKADTVMATAALANKIGEKISFLSFLGNITPKADTTQTIDLILKIAVEVIAFCQINGIPQPNPQAFASSLGSNYQGASLMRMIGLVSIDAILPLGPNFLAKIHSIIDGADSSIITQNPVFLAVKNFLPGNNDSDKFGFITQSFNSVQGWMSNLVEKTGITPQSISKNLGNFIQIADDNLDFVAAFLDQTTNYYEHTGIQTVARSVILAAHQLVQAEPPELPPAEVVDSAFTVGQKVEVFYEEDEEWYEAVIKKVKGNKYFVHYVGYESDDDEWIEEENIR